MSPTATPESGEPSVDAPARDDQPSRDDLHLKREVLLARLFPTEVTRPKLGRYDVLEFVGEGGMGTVFAAYDPKLDRRVAVKLLRQSGDGGQRRARLLREAKALARLSHLNIVTIHEVWEEQGEVYIAMEFVEGETLFEWQATARPWKGLLEVYRQAGQGLMAVHEAGLVYRDFKPHNVIRRNDGVVKLLDFGLARQDEGAPEPRPPRASTIEVEHEPDDRLTRPGAVMGTPAYMAPEQREGLVADAASDQFSFCVSLWEALLGALPQAAGRSAPATGPERLVPAWVRRVLERGLAPVPAERYPSMGALLRDLGRDPAVQRRRVLLGAAGVALTVGGGLAIAELRAEPPTACVTVRSVWGPEQRREAEAGVVQAGGEAGQQTWTLLGPRLDRHAEALQELRHEGCQSHRRGLLPEAHYDLQVACLDRHEAGFGELRDLLRRSDPSAVSNANRAITQLPSPTQCADIDALRAEHPPPDDPETAARVAALRGELARAQAEESAGLYVAAQARAAAVLDEARALDYAPLRAEALVRWGSVGMQARSPDASERLGRALWLAIATEQRRVAAEAAAKRIFARVEIDDRSADVHEAITLARALVERTGAADWRTRWALANNVGITQERQGEPTDALRAYGHALAEVPEGDERGSFERAITLLNMAPVQVRVGDSQAGRRSAGLAVDALTALLGSEHPQVHTARASLAVVLRSTGHFDEAQAILAEVLEPYSSANPAPLWMLYDAAQVAWGRGDLAAVSGWCARARPQWSDADPVPALWSLMFTAMEARVAAARGQPDPGAALERLGPAVEQQLRPTFALESAEVLLLAGQAARVVELVQPVLDDPDAAESTGRHASLLSGLSWVEQRQWARARARLAPLVTGDEAQRRLSPENLARAVLGLGAAEAGLGQSAQATARAEQALEILEGFDPNNATVRAAQTMRARTAVARPR